MMLVGGTTPHKTAGDLRETKQLPEKSEGGPEGLHRQGQDAFCCHRTEGYTQKPVLLRRLIVVCGKMWEERHGPVHLLGF